jgi:hypothetical protein
VVGVWLETDDGRRLLDGVGALEAMAVGTAVAGSPTSRTGR